MAILALSLVVVLTVLWEVGEYVGDRLLDTALVPSKRNSAEDIFFGTLGGAVGVAFASVIAMAARRSALTTLKVGGDGDAKL